MKKAVEIDGRDVNLRQLTYGEYDECLILSETMVEYQDVKGKIVTTKSTKESIYISEATKRMLCVKKPHEEGYNEDLEQKTKWINSLEKNNGKKVRELALEILNSPGDVKKK